MKRRSAWVYSVVFLGTQALLLLICPLIARTDWFLTHDGLPTLREQGFAHRIAPSTRCDIVVIGDSTALSDFVPSVLEARTGLSACNLAEVGAIGGFLGEHQAIDVYLRNHPAPRFLVAGFTPSGLDPEHPPGRSPFPTTIQFALDYAPGPFLWHFLLTHPRAALEWDLWVERALGTHLVEVLARKQPAMWRVDERGHRDRAGGVWRVPAPAQTSCMLLPPAGPADIPARRASVASFRRQFASARTQVLVYATPVAACDSSLAVLRAEAGSIPDLPLEVYPIGDFVESNMHLGAEAADRFSAEVANQIAALERQRVLSPEASPQAR